MLPLLGHMIEAKTFPDFPPCHQAALQCFLTFMGNFWLTDILIGFIDAYLEIFKSSGSVFLIVIYYFVSHLG